MLYAEGLVAYRQRGSQRLDAASTDRIPPHESGCKTLESEDHSNGGQQAAVKHAFHFDKSVHLMVSIRYNV